jgi:hypothetical protein
VAGSWRGPAERRCARYPDGVTVTAYVDLRDPKRSVLEAPTRVAALRAPREVDIRGASDEQRAVGSHMRGVRIDREHERTRLKDGWSERVELDRVGLATSAASGGGMTHVRVRCAHVGARGLSNSPDWEVRRKAGFTPAQFGLVQ